MCAAEGVKDMKNRFNKRESKKHSADSSSSQIPLYIVVAVDYEASYALLLVENFIFSYAF